MLFARMREMRRRVGVRYTVHLRNERGRRRVGVRYMVHLRNEKGRREWRNWVSLFLF